MRYLFLLIVFTVVPTASAAERITPPKEHFGFNIGDDYCLANYQQLMKYWAKVDTESERVKVMSIGTTEEGRPQFMAIVTSPANHAKLSHYQDINRRMVLAEGVSEPMARQLAAEGKSVIWIDGGLHATEVLCPQMLIETLYQLASADDTETLRILDDVIILLVHANPDGMDLVSDWYMREKDPKKRSTAGVPRLYQKYIGHDNNRDFFGHTQAETKNMNRVMYHEWFPHVVFNHHQTGPPGTILFCPPFRDPFNYNVDPLVINGIDRVGAAIMERFLQENKPGATTRSGARYSGWWNGGLRTTSTFHNMIGLLTETIGNPTPMTIPYNPKLQLPRGDYLAPIAPQKWHFRQSVEYSVSSNKAVLDYASRHREKMLFNMWRMGMNSVEKGSRDSWTVTPKIVDAARAGASNAITLKGNTQFNRAFRDPAQRDPRGYIIPANQPDFLTAIKFVNTLMGTGLKVHRATSDFAIKGKTYPAGSFVLKSAQAFRPHLLDMFEPQDHPNDFAYPDAPPTPPYDIAGWTLAYSMGVQVDRILDGFDGPFELLKGEVAPTPGKVQDGQGVVGFFVDARVNDAFRAVNRLHKSGESVARLMVSAAGQPAGTFFIARKPSTDEVVRKLASELGTNFTAAMDTPSLRVAVNPVRVALWDRYGGSMPSGWTRWLLERFEYPFQVVYPPELDKGGLKEKFDVLILVDGAIQRTGFAGTKKGGFGGGDGSGETNIPAEYRNQRGSISTKATLPKLREFLEAGGTIVTIGSSTALANQLGLPVGNHLATVDGDGKERPLSREKFYVPGSLLRTRVNTTHPLAWGMPEEADVMFVGSPTFRVSLAAEAKGIQRVAWFDSKTPLRSGWAWGQEHLQGGVAIADAKVGQGHLVMCGPEILFRAQPHGTFKFLFNSIARAGAPRY